MPAQQVPLDTNDIDTQKMKTQSRFGFHFVSKHTSRSSFHPFGKSANALGFNFWLVEILVKVVNPFEQIENIAIDRVHLIILH